MYDKRLDESVHPASLAKALTDWSLRFSYIQVSCVHSESSDHSVASQACLPWIIHQDHHS